MQSLLADAWWEAAGGLFIGFFCAVILPLVFLLLSHQRKMAELFRRGTSLPDQQNRIEQLEAEVRELKARTNEIARQNESRPLSRERLDAAMLADDFGG